MDSEHIWKIVIPCLMFAVLYGGMALWARQSNKAERRERDAAVKAYTDQYNSALRVYGQLVLLFPQMSDVHQKAVETALQQCQFTGRWLTYGSVQDIKEATKEVKTFEVFVWRQIGYVHEKMPIV